MHRALLLPLIVVSSPAFSQTCDVPAGPIETCLVGAWIGSSTIPQALERAMQSMPDAIRANFNDFGRPVGMVVYDDGFFETFPMGANGSAAFRDDDGDVTTFQVNGQTTTTVGYMTALGGTLDLCYLPSAQGNLTGEMTVTTPDGSSTVPIFAMPDNAFTPVITYTCSGNRMQQMVALPAPLGTITYDLSRVPTSMFEDAMAAQIEDLPVD